VQRTTLRPEPWHDVEVLKEYSDRLVTKLEERNIALAEANVGIPVKVNIDSGGKPNGIPERR
jgi:hypothetical protein